MSLKTAIDSIDSTIANAVSFNPTFYGICTLQEKNEKTFPLQNKGQGQGAKISWNDKKTLQIYHRIIDLEKESDPSLGIGSKPYIFRTYSMRLVGLGTRELLTVADYEDNDQICNTISDSLPNFVTSLIYLEAGDHEVDKITVYESEFAGVTSSRTKASSGSDTFKDKTLDGVAFWIEYTLKFKICG